MTTSRCSHLPEVLPDCTSSAAPVVKTVEDCGSLVNGQPQYVMQVSAKDGQLLSTVVRTLATQSPFNDRPMCRICHEGSSQEDLLSPCECTGTLGTIHRSCLEHWLSSSNTSYCELCHFRFAVERKPRPLVEVSFRYHCRLYNEWRRTNQRVILLIPKSVNVPSNQPSLLGLHSVKRNSKETVV